MHGRDMSPGGCGEQRVAVGRRPRHAVGADRAIGAGAVLDHHGLPQRPSDFCAHHSGHEVEGGAGWERHHNGEGSRWPCLGRGSRKAKQDHGDAEND